MDGMMPAVPPPLPQQGPRAPGFADPVLLADARRGAGVGTMLFDFCCGSATVSTIAFVAFVWFVFSRPGGFGLEGVVLGIALVTLFVYNGAMLAAVALGAAAKGWWTGAAVTVRPRRAMFAMGLVTPLVGFMIVWALALHVAAPHVGGALGLAVVGAIPAGLMTSVMAEPRE